MQTDPNPEIIPFKNPFPVEPVTESGHLIKTSLLVLESMRWTYDLCYNLLELIFDEIENQSRLFCLSDSIPFKLARE